MQPITNFCIKVVPSHVDKRVWMFFFFVENYLNKANSHQDHYVSLNILVIITCQGDIFELGLDGNCLLFIA